MEANIKLDRTLVAVNVDGIVHLLLELTAPAAVAAMRAPIDVVVVLDRSGSMSGEPMRAVREATCDLLRVLGPDDQVGVVAFDDEAELVLPLARHDVDVASARVREIDARGVTNLSGGWLKGAEMLMAAIRADAVRRILVLTDGHANRGITEPAQLCKMAAAAKEQGVTTTTIGFADDCDEVLLAAIADAGAGNDYWCAGPDQAPQVFAAEFVGLASVVAQNISVEIRPCDSVELAVLNEYPITQVPGGVQVALGDAYGSERRRVVAALRHPAPPAVGTVRLGELIVRWASAIGDVALNTVTIPVTVDASDEALADAAPDPEVTEHVNVLRAAHARKTAHENLRRGDLDGARRALNDAVCLLTTMPDQAEELAQARFDLDELEGGGWTEASTKRLHATMRSTQKGRPSRFDNPQS